MYKSFAQLFEKKPLTWGSRGDPYLWQEMHKMLEIKPLPNNKNAVLDILSDSFYYITNHKITENKLFKIERFSHGGMSSGVISPLYWKETVIPYLIKRFETLEDV